VGADTGAVEPAPAGCGCAGAPGRPEGAFALAALLGLALRRRR
jgi:MYXO-CTERM domain-containing protein